MRGTGLSAPFPRRRPHSGLLPLFFFGGTDVPLLPPAVGRSAAACPLFFLYAICFRGTEAVRHKQALFVPRRHQSTTLPAIQA